MNNYIKELIESLKRGKFEDPTEKIALLAAALRERGGANVALLVDLLKAPQIPLRLAAIDACREREEPELIVELRTLVNDSDVRVRRKIAEIANTLPEKIFAQAIKSLAHDEDDDVRRQAIKATSGKPKFFELQRETLLNDADYRVRMAAAQALHAQRAPSVVQDFISALANDSDDDVQNVCAENLEQRLKDSREQTVHYLPTDVVLLTTAGRVLKTLKVSKFPELAKLLAEKTVAQVNPEQLARYGKDLTLSAIDGTLPRAHLNDDLVNAALEVLTATEPRSLVLVGQSGVGKTAIVNSIVYELMKPENGGWHVLRVSPTDFLSGTQYLGEWESKLNKLVEAIRRPRHVLLYIPNISDLSTIGKFSGSDSNVATALAPHIEDGSVLVLGESTESEFEAGLGSVPSIRRLFAKLVIEEPSVESTRAILHSVRDEFNADLSNDMLDSLLELSGQYLGHCARPGNALALLREIIATRSTNEEPASPRTVLNAISKSTGIPADFLDDTIPLDLHSVRSFFDKRVMGQPEAIDAVIDLLTLIKSGLTDPNKPFGIMLFIGPTGVGKTELARSLAEFVFGDPARLLRYDMSEYASYEGYERLIGMNRPGVLTGAVRQKPFSVVLLDEIEKAHYNIFDLCLQIFDAGRLTDGRGRTVDFRRTIVILTSNIGATAAGTILGFNVRPPQQQTNIDRDKVSRELALCFRPEFLNRIDRIINFRPLSLEVTEKIARREVDAVLQRSGIARRNLSIDIDPSVVTLLVKEGYSPNFGARPLRRAVERLLLLPLARAISTGRISADVVLRLTATGNKVDVKVVSKPQLLQKSEPVLPFVELAESLVREIEELEKRTEPLTDRKTELLAQTRTPDFYKDEQRKAETFDEIHKLDQFLSACDGLAKVVRGIYERCHKGVAKKDEESVSERVHQLSAELEYLSFVATSTDARDLSDAIICVRLVDRTEEDLGGVETLTKMYAGFARRRRLTVEVVCEAFAEGLDCAYLHVTGLGAYRLFKQEIGLHQLDHRVKFRASRNGKERHREDREVLRVDVLPVQSQADKAFSSKLKTEATRTKLKRGRILPKPTFEVSLFHQPSLRSLRGLFAGDKDCALTNAQMILYSLVKDDQSAADQQPEQLIRHYDLGTGAKIKDTRSGKMTSRIDQVLKGHLDLFLLPTLE